MLNPILTAKFSGETVPFASIYKKGGGFVASFDYGEKQVLSEDISTAKRIILDASKTVKHKGRLTFKKVNASGDYRRAQGPRPAPRRRGVGGQVVRKNLGEGYPKKVLQYAVDGFVVGEIFNIAKKFHTFIYPESGKAVEKDFKKLIPAKLYVAKQFHGRGVFLDPAKKSYKTRHNQTWSCASGRGGRIRTTRDNPKDDLEKARKFSKVFHWGIDPEYIEDVEFEVPETLILLGEITEISYLTRKGKEREKTEWQHEFTTPLPKVYTDNNRKNLYILGGNFEITKRGIEG